MTKHNQSEPGEEPVESLPADATPSEVNQEEVARRAHDRFRERGGQHGQDQADWFEAEREVRERAPRRLSD
ncbi:hypothetical protein BH24ACI4_BH24ACI4_13370 [soil metagenome]